MTRILPRPFFLTRAELSFPRNRAAPIAADLSFADEAGVQIEAAFDWRQTGPQTWEIRIETDAGRVTVASGGRRLIHGERTLVDAEKQEYPVIYQRFLELIANGVSDVDLSPLVHVADAFMLGERRDGRTVHGVSTAMPKVAREIFGHLPDGAADRTDKTVRR